MVILTLVKMDFFKLKLPLFDEEALTLNKDQGQKQTSGLLIFKKYPQALWSSVVELKLAFLLAKFATYETHWPFGD